MDLMAIRRSLLMQENSEKWDYIITPPNGVSHGKFYLAKIDMTSGQIAIVEYKNITQRSSGIMVIDGYFCRGSFIGDCILDGGVSNLLPSNKLTANDGKFTITATRNGSITIGNSRTAEEGTWSALECDYIKIKIS